MSGLNLIPNAAIVATEGGLFLANLLLVNRLFVSPYLKLKKARTSLTEGSEDQARESLRQLELKRSEVAQARKNAKEEWTFLWETSKRELTAMRDKIIEEAQTTASSEISRAMKEISEAIAREQPKIETESQELAQVICQKLLG